MENVGCLYVTVAGGGDGFVFLKQMWFPRVEKARWSAYCDEGKLTAFCSYQHLNKFY